MSAPSISGLSVELLLRFIDVKYGYFTLLYFNAIQALHERTISCERNNRESARAFLRLQNFLSVPDLNGRKKRRSHNKDKAPVDVNPSSSSKG